jgi:hypothetical protein
LYFQVERISVAPEPILVPEPQLFSYHLNAPSVPRLPVTSRVTLPPLQMTVSDAVKAVGVCDLKFVVPTVNVASNVHPFESVIVTVCNPAKRPLTSSDVWPVFHR